MNKKLKDERELLSKPGDTIIETLEHIKMSQVELGERMGKTPSKVNDIISGKEPLTMATALLLEKVLGIEAEFWLNRELRYREKLTRLEQEEALEECKDWLRAQPINELKKSGYIKSDKVGGAMVDEVLKFYGVAAPAQWESIYIEELVSAKFRKSEAHQTTLSSMAAWLRIGEIEMRKLNLKTFDKDKFKASLVEIKSLVRRHPEDFAEKVQAYCADAGVAVVYVMSISKAPISGAARWLGGNPLIQLSDRYKSNDHFWFTFFHEAGHILLHGKKDIFVEDFEVFKSNPEKEEEANDFASKSLLSERAISELTSPITEVAIRKVAHKYDTHPAIVLARLQKLKKVSYSFGASLKVRVVLDHLFNKKGWNS
jgi:HTH-type transcriptional regulator/antitoxin HigA